MPIAQNSLINRPAGGETAKVGNLALIPLPVGLSRFMVIRGQIQAIVLIGTRGFMSILLTLLTKFGSITLLVAIYLPTKSVLPPPPN